MRFWWLHACSALAMFLAPHEANAEDFPNKPVRLVVPSPGGSALDQFARSLAEDLTKKWKKTVYVESKSGAGGGIAASAVVQSPADGYTLFLINEQLLVINRFAFRKLPYDPDKSFTPISLLTQADQLIMASSTVPFKDFAGMLAYAKKNPKKLNYGRWAPGSSPHLAMETLNKDADIEIVGIPYRGVGPVMLAMQGNEVQLTVMSAPTGAPMIESGKAIPLAVASTVRSAQYPNVPTTVELGYPRVLAGTWYALVGPAGVPQAVTEKVERDVREVLNDPGFFVRYPTLRGWNVIASNPSGLLETVKRQTPLIGEMMKTANVEPE